MSLHKYLSVAASIAIFVVATTAAHAQTATGNFNVSALLTAKCTNTTAGTPTVDFGTYLSGDPAVTPAAVNLTFECTRGLNPPTMALDVGADKISTATGAVGGSAATGAGVLPTLNLYYTLSIAGTKTTTGTAADTTGIGTADVYTFAVSGTLPQQAGSCATGTCGPATQLRTLTVTY